MDIAHTLYYGVLLWHDDTVLFENVLGKQVDDISFNLFPHRYVHVINF